MAEHVVPQVYQHLVSVSEDPRKPLDEVLLRKIDERTAELLGDDQRIQILGAIQTLLPTLQQDATPATNLVMRLIQPSKVKFEQVDALLTQNGSSNEQYIQGLESPDKDVNILTLHLLSKATASPSGVGLVASKVEVVRTWIRLWLTTPNTAVAGKAADVLECFLMAGIDTDQATIESNLMVRRLFRDRNIYESLFSLCSLKTLGSPDQPDRNQKTIAQARLLDFLVKIDHAGSPIRVSQFPDVEQHYEIIDPDRGILYFGFMKMMDFRNDDLILSTLIMICANYLVKRCPKENSRSTYALTFLKANGLHSTCLSEFLNPTSNHRSWLLGDSITYLQSYCSVWRDDLVEDKDLCITILETLTRQFKHATKSDWHSSQTLDLNLVGLQSLPKSLHLLQPSNDDGPLLHLPTDTSNARVIGVLTDIFCTVNDDRGLIGQAAQTIGYTDRMIARVLYSKYYKRHPDIWSNVIKLADTVALTASALAAIFFMDSFVDTTWALVDKGVMPMLPAEEELAQMRGGTPAPISGIDVMLFERGVAEIVLPYVLTPPKSFSIVRHSHASFNNSEDPAQTVAKAKTNLTTHILECLKRMEPNQEIRQILEVFTKQVDANTRAASSQGAGESVATMRR